MAESKPQMVLQGFRDKRVILDQDDGQEPAFQSGRASSQPVPQRRTGRHGMTALA